MRVASPECTPLQDVVHDHLSFLGNGVHLNLLHLLDILGDDDGVVARNLRRLRQVVGNYIHRSTRDNIRRADKDRYPTLSQNSVASSKLVVHTNFIKEKRELVSVLRHVDHLGGRAINLDILAIESQRYVVGCLTSHGQDDTTRSLRVVDVENGLQAETPSERGRRWRQLLGI